MADTVAKVALIDPATGKLYPETVPGGVGGATGGGPQSLDFGFSGTLVIRTGKQYWISPADASIELVRATAILGTMPTVGTAQPTVFQVMLNAASIATLSLADGVRSASTTNFSGQQVLPASSVLSIDITGIPASATPSKAGDAVIQVWWKYV